MVGPDAKDARHSSAVMCIPEKPAGQAAADEPPVSDEVLVAEIEKASAQSVADTAADATRFAAREKRDATVIVGVITAATMTIGGFAMVAKDLVAAIGSVAMVVVKDLTLALPGGLGLVAVFTGVAVFATQTIGRGGVGAESDGSRETVMDQPAFAANGRPDLFRSEPASATGVGAEDDGSGKTQTFLEYLKKSGRENRLSRLQRQQMAEEPPIAPEPDQYLREYQEQSWGLFDSDSSAQPGSGQGYSPPPPPLPPSPPPLPSALTSDGDDDSK